MFYYGLIFVIGSSAVLTGSILKCLKNKNYARSGKIVTIFTNNPNLDLESPLILEQQSRDDYSSI